MAKKKRNQTCSEKGSCKNHQFVFKPVNKSLYIKKAVKIKLCPKINKFNDQYQVIIPQYNKDNKFYTPSFILQEEKKFYNENDERLHSKHNKKVQQAIQQEKSIMVPRPNRNTNYCAVCKNDYEDYLQHLNSQSHRICIEKSKFNNDILELQKYFINSSNENKQQVSKIKNVGSVTYSQASTQINLLKRLSIFQQ